MNLEIGLVFDPCSMSGRKSMSRCSVGLLSLFRRVVAAPMSSLFVGVVRCSDVLFQILFDDSRTSRTLFHTKCTVWNCDGNWTSVRYLYDFWGVGDRPPVQAPIERWAELADSRIVGKSLQPTLLGVDGRSQNLLERGKSNFTAVVCFSLQCYFRRVISLSVFLRIWPMKLVNCMN